MAVGASVAWAHPALAPVTLPLAGMVGPGGRVIAVDIQPKMIERLKRRAAKAGVLERIDGRIASSESLGLKDLDDTVDFTLAFAVVHEFPDPARFFAEVAVTSKPSARLLLAEPKGHVKPAFFHLLQVGRGHLHDPPTCLGGPGEGDLVDLLALHQLRADRVAGAGDRVD
jgi:SAM-dependent methyltransferase